MSSRVCSRAWWRIMDRASAASWAARYEVLDDPDTLIEIAEWESAEARVAHMQEGAATGAYAPLLDVLAAPFRATVIRQLP